MEKTYTLVIRRDYHKTAEIQIPATSMKEARSKFYDGDQYLNKLSDALYDANFDGGNDTVESISEVKI